MELEIDENTELLTVLPEELPKKMQVTISEGVTTELVTDAVNSLKQQIEYHWHSICEKVPKAKVSVLKKEKTSIVVQISAE